MTHRLMPSATDSEEEVFDAEVCSNCRMTQARRTAYCPYCGFRLTHPWWKKLGAWILLGLICYGLVDCHLRLINGFEPARTGAPQAPPD